MSGSPIGERRIARRTAAGARRALALTLTLAAACTGAGAGGDVATSPSAEPSEVAVLPAEGRAPRGVFEEAACALQEEHLRRIWRGHDAERSGEIEMIPRKPDMVGTWLSHSGPWRYVQHVPLLFYGPGRVPEGRVVNRPVTLADIAPTHAELLDFDFDAPDGEALSEAILPGAKPPKLIVTMIWDSAGRNVLAEHPDAWPTLRSLIERGTWFENTTVGSSPSVTPAVHTTIGTGAFPRTHGIVDIRYRVEGGEIVGARGQGARHLRVPSLADEYDLAHDNEPLVGLVGSEGTLGMLGKGSFREGGDEDLAVTRTGDAWLLEGSNAEAFSFPDYASDFPGLEGAIRRLDLEDGVRDRKWGEEPLEDEKDVSATPAFGEYQQRLVREVLDREPFGRRQGPGTDLLYLNFREIDAAGHAWSMNSPQMEAVVRSTDDALADLVRRLDRTVGEGEWVLTVSADHGAAPHTDLTGAFVIKPPKLEEDLEAEFGEGSVEAMRVTQIWMNMEMLGEEGIPLRDVVAFLRDYTKSQHDAAQLGDGKDGPAFQAVFPGAIMKDPPCLSAQASPDDGGDG